MSDIVERLRAITTEAAERLAKWCGTRLPTIADALRSLAAERDALKAENEKLRAALKECADDLEEEINGKYRGSQNIYIHEMHRFDRDMAPVMNDRKLLQKEKK